MQAHHNNYGPCLLPVLRVTTGSDKSGFLVTAIKISVYKTKIMNFGTVDLKNI